MIPVAAWEDVAWPLWRYQHLSWRQISDHLAWEGWCVHPLLVERAVCERVGRRWKLEAATPKPPSAFGR